MPDEYNSKKLLSLHNLSNQNNLQLFQRIKRQNSYNSSLDNHYSLFKQKTQPEIYKNHFQSILIKYKDFQEVYTDPSKNKKRVDFATVNKEIT